MISNKSVRSSTTINDASSLQHDDSPSFMFQLLSYIIGTSSEEDPKFGGLGDQVNGILDRVGLLSFHWNQELSSLRLVYWACL